jgi:hypothetical protein
MRPHSFISAASLPTIDSFSVLSEERLIIDNISLRYLKALKHNPTDQPQLTPHRQLANKEGDVSLSSPVSVETDHPVWIMLLVQQHICQEASRRQFKCSAGKLNIVPTDKGVPVSVDMNINGAGMSTWLMPMAVRAAYQQVSLFL